MHRGMPTSQPSLNPLLPLPSSGPAPGIFSLGVEKTETKMKLGWQKERKTLLSSA